MWTRQQDCQWKFPWFIDEIFWYFLNQLKYVLRDALIPYFFLCDNTSHFQGRRYDISAKKNISHNHDNFNNTHMHMAFKTCIGSNFKMFTLQQDESKSILGDKCTLCTALHISKRNETFCSMWCKAHFGATKSGMIFESTIEQYWPSVLWARRILVEKNVEPAVLQTTVV